MYPYIILVSKSPLSDLEKIEHISYFGLWFLPRFLRPPVSSPANKQTELCPPEDYTHAWSAVEQLRDAKHKCPPPLPPLRYLLPLCAKRLTDFPNVFD